MSSTAAASFTPYTDSHEVSLKRLGIWLLVQLSISIICACLPTYGPLLPNGAFLSMRLKGWYSFVGSLLGRRHTSSNSGSEINQSLDSNTEKRHHKETYGNLSDGGEKSIFTSVVGGGNHAYDHERAEIDYANNVIKIRQEVEMV